MFLLTRKVPRKHSNVGIGSRFLHGPLIWRSVKIQHSLQAVSLAQTQVLDCSKCASMSPVTRLCPAWCCQPAS